VSVAGLHRFFVRRGITRKKKTGHAIDRWASRMATAKRPHYWRACA
jgi:hypothetical protein